jgi:trimeric autotransporter adhesin
MKKIFITLAVLLSAFAANAQFSLTTLSYSQDFNTLDTSGTASGNLPTGWAISERGSATADNTYIGSNGATNAGNTYSCGAPGSSDRALGSLGSGNNRSRYGMWITNNTGSTIYSMTFNFTCEQWKLGDTTTTFPDTTFFEYSTAATAIYDSTAAWISANALNITSAVTSGVPVGALDGNLPSNQISKTGTINVTIPNGASVWFRFFDVNIGGSDDMIALDDLSITFGTVASTRPNIVGYIPNDNATNVALGNTDLKVYFDKMVSTGAGNFYVNNLTAGSTQTIAASACIANGDTIIIPNIAIAAASNYAVQFDSNAVMYQTNMSYGIYDNTSWNFSGVNPYPSNIGRFPFDNSNNANINTAIYARYSLALTAGTGTITLKNITAGTQQTYNVPGPNVVISGDSIKLVGVTPLAYATQYAVLADSTVANNNGYNIRGIYFDTVWNFTTEAAPITSLNESFTSCNNFSIGGGFTQQSVAGNAFWRCSTIGNTDANAVSVNGASATQAFANEDWLISPKLDISATMDPYLHFWSRTRFSGIATREVMISTNYTGNVTNSTWTPLLVQNLPNIDTIYKGYTNTSLNAYKNNIINIAWKYTSTADMAAPSANEWLLDDINITSGSVSIQTSSIPNTDIRVIGNTANNVLNLEITSATNENYAVKIVDLTGKIIAQHNITIFAGSNIAKINLPYLSTGVYMAVIGNNNGKAVVKFGN